MILRENNENQKRKPMRVKGMGERTIGEGMKNVNLYLEDGVQLPRANRFGKAEGS